MRFFSQVEEAFIVIRDEEDRIVALVPNDRTEVVRLIGGAPKLLEAAKYALTTCEAALRECPIDGVTAARIIPTLELLAYSIDTIKGSPEEK